jgi:hypothetical protein
VLVAAALGQPSDFDLTVQQVTFGPKNHIFGYIGHVQNIPWNGTGRYIVALETDFQDRMPRAADAANVVLVDTWNGNSVQVIDKSRGWNFQQGTMFYWNPEAPDTQIFFNDRDATTGKVFTVLYDISKRRRLREFRFDDTPFGNSGVAQNGGSFLGLNYGRLARLRLVTGYLGAYDWTAGVAAPEDDGIFLVEVTTGKQRLLVSYRRLAELVKAHGADITGQHLFINHTLWNRDDNRIYFYVRADFDSREKRVNVPCSIRPDGSGLTAHSIFIGGHPEWERGSRIIGSRDGRMVLYDVDRKEVVGTIGTADTFPNPEGDTALSPDYNWVVNGSRRGDANLYTVFRRSDGARAQTEGFPHPGLTSGELRVDGSPCWNRTNNRILFPAIAADEGHTRQLFEIQIRMRR